MQIQLIDLKKYRADNGNTEFKRKFGFIDQWWHQIPAIGFIQGDTVFEQGAIFATFIENAHQEDSKAPRKAVFLQKIVGEFEDGEEDSKYLFIGFADNIREAEIITNIFVQGRSIDQVAELINSEGVLVP